MIGNIVVLTATITPRSGQSDLAISSPADRLNDYHKALAFYQALLDSSVIQGVVFAENSGYDLTATQKLFPDPRIEWLSTYDLDYPSSYHRGYGEFRLIDHAMTKSSTVANLAADAVVWKVTGRYIVENLRNVIRFAPKEFDLYCATNGHWTEMSVMAWTRHGHAKLLLGVWELFTTGMAPELILAPRLVHSTRADCRIIDVFSWPPLIVGRRGTDGGQFTGWRARWGFRAKLLPRLLQMPFR
jgi:hypothetical protein